MTVGDIGATLEDMRHWVAMASHYGHGQHLFGWHWGGVAVFGFGSRGWGHRWAPTLYILGLRPPPPAKTGPKKIGNQNPRTDPEPANPNPHTPFCEKNPFEAGWLRWAPTFLHRWGPHFFFCPAVANPPHPSSPQKQGHKKEKIGGPTGHR